VPRTIACQPDGGLEPSELVDQATFPSVRPGPDTALGDLVDLLPGPPPRPCDLGDEVLVDVVQEGVDTFPLGIAERLEPVEHPGVLDTGDGVGGDAETLQQLSVDRLAGDHPDRTGDGGGLGDDGIRTEGDVVATRARHVTHGGDDGLAGLPGQLALPTD